MRKSRWTGRGRPKTPRDDAKKSGTIVADCPCGCGVDPAPPSGWDGQRAPPSSSTSARPWVAVSHVVLPPRPERAQSRVFDLRARGAASDGAPAETVRSPGAPSERALLYRRGDAGWREGRLRRRNGSAFSPSSHCGRVLGPAKTTRNSRSHEGVARAATARSLSGRSRCPRARPETGLLRRPGTASIFRPKDGSAKACSTSAEVTWSFTTRVDRTTHLVVDGEQARQAGGGRLVVPLSMIESNHEAALVVGVLVGPVPGMPRRLHDHRGLPGWISCSRRMRKEGNRDTDQDQDRGSPSRPPRSSCCARVLDGVGVLCPRWKRTTHQSSRAPTEEGLMIGDHPQTSAVVEPVHVLRGRRHRRLHRDLPIRPAGRSGGDRATPGGERGRNPRPPGRRGDGPGGSAVKKTDLTNPFGPSPQTFLFRAPPLRRPLAARPKKVEIRGHRVAQIAHWDLTHVQKTNKRVAERNGSKVRTYERTERRNHRKSPGDSLGPHRQ